jgi:hypothetical protein
MYYSDLRQLDFHIPRGHPSSSDRTSPTSSHASTLALSGGGFMGSGIAETSAAVGFEVFVYEPAHELLEASRKRLAGSLAKLLSRGRLSADEAEALPGRVSSTTDMNDLADINAAVEAVIETVEVKTAFFKSGQRFWRRTPPRLQWPRSLPPPPDLSGSSACTSSHRYRR